MDIVMGDWNTDTYTDSFVPRARLHITTSSTLRVSTASGESRSRSFAAQIERLEIECALRE
jgi:hypothetical protein